MDKVTVLVAAFNAAPYLNRCLSSLAGQTHTDIEVICIDDASTDGTPKIFNDMTARDIRFHAIRLAENCGQAHARNIGLAAATGKYVCMLDADDWFSPDAIEQAVAVFKRHENTDSVLFDLVMEQDNRHEHYAMPAFDTLTGKEAFCMSLTWSIHGLYMTRTEIHKQFPFDESCRLYSDDNTTRLHYLASREVRRCGGQYHYLQHAESATHKVSPRRYELLRANESMRAQMEAMGVDPKLTATYEEQRWLNLIDTYMFHHCHAHKLSRAEREHGLRELKRIWLSIDRTALPRNLTSKFGYRPMASWPLFRLQEWAYFTLRAMAGKNR